ncbi:MAG: DUF2189 domain-containing protein [Steroidobacteraceae bacterium]
MATETLFHDIEVTSSEIDVRKIGVRELWKSLKEGYEDFNAKPSFGIFLTAIYPLFALFLTLFAVGENLNHLVFSMIAGLTLLGPVVSVGLFAMSRRREGGLDLSWRSAFDFVHSYSFAPIAALSVVMMLLYTAWLFMAQFIYEGVFGADLPASLAALVAEITTTRRGGALILYGVGVGAIFAFTALAMSVFAFPLLLDKPTTSFTAVSTSIRAVLNNFIVMLIWAVIVVALLVVGASLFLIGLAAVLPILGHATWHLYRKVVES